MHLFFVLSFLVASVLAIDSTQAMSCNADSSLSKGLVPLSKLCSGGELNNDGWLSVKCDVGAEVMKFSVGLNWCVANYDGNLALAKNGNAMQSCAKSDCQVLVEKKKRATLKCTATHCSGEVDLDKAINFTGTYLTCGGMIGSGGQLQKRLFQDEL
ncbi:hypothetical protein NUU61_008577 [Penicillium alfredii]|uniref:Cyanovirin-N domain-containing protein n=1 Tax=Penicillium alfredii TaxID=1506179 RepID=A0A9W9JWC9_9EURO|nr:uncharacterized protein NUU61_008577 [Penicillium alfredii]KAJ5083998.1 hypothetical protein NUU61_008577 [Penicillium alfredii]